jgi:starvation-inducible DNA-binding protein
MATLTALRSHLPATDLEDPRRDEIIKALNSDLACTVDLALSAKQAHWNIEGPNFQGLHELFDLVAAGAREWSDLLAERLVALGGTAHATAEDVAATGLEQFPREERDWERLTLALHARLLATSQRMRSHADAMDDEIATQDVYVEILRDLEKRAWMLRAHLGENAELR